MTSNAAPMTGDIARRAFDTVASLERVKSLSGLERVVKSSFRQLGFDVWVGFDSVTQSGNPDVDILFGHTHEAWEARYKEAGHDQHDAMIRASLTASEPFFWSDITSRTTLSAAEQQVMNEASEFRLKEGFVSPMVHLDGSITAVLLTGEKIEISNPDVRAASHLLSVYFGSAGRRLIRERAMSPEPEVLLTERQLEILKWVREGKSSSDIGGILGLSRYTVHDHVERACARLGVRTRIQAVAEAALRGLLEL